MADLKVKLKRHALSKNGNKTVICNIILESVLNNLLNFNAEGEVNEAGGTQVEFMNSEDGRLPGLRWRDLRLNKHTL